MTNAASYRLRRTRRRLSPLFQRRSACAAAKKWSFSPIASRSASARTLAGCVGGTPTGTWRKMPQTAAVSPAGVCFVLRGNKNIAATPAISKRDLEGTHMGAILTQEQFDREAGFRLSLSIMNRLMEENLLTPKEYRQIEGILGRKFSPVWAGLPDTIKDKSARQPLIIRPYDGNMHHDPMD